MLNNVFKTDMINQTEEYLSWNCHFTMDIFSQKVYRMNFLLVIRSRYEMSIG